MDIPEHPHHTFYQPVPPDGQQRGSAAAPVPPLSFSQRGRRRTRLLPPGYQVPKDEIKQILIGIVTHLISPKWWLYHLLEEMGAPKAFLKKFKGMSDLQIRTAILRSQITREKWFAILKRDNYTCQYCFHKDAPRELEVDHRIPLHKGGTNDDSNLITACIPCNCGKGIQDA
jgi:hypothetical protein